jgi:2-polyprenyl-6-methoxyphenol hydroxylase-like FAD-dependent oxidoreductase
VSAPLRVLVVGAGIAGLAFARAATDHGMTVEIVERVAAWEPAGSGLFLPANAVRALGDLGLRDVLDRSEPVRRQRVCDSRGRVLADIDTRRLWGDVGDCLAVHRADLHSALLTATRDVPIRLGTTVEPDPDRTHEGEVSFTDGSTGRYDVMVGADGIESAIRRSLPGGGAPRFAGQICWRYVVDDVPGLTGWTARLGRERTFLTIGIGSGRVYCYADLNVAGPLEPSGDWRGHFSGFADPVPGLLEHGTTAYFAPIREVIQPQLTAGRVVLIGDAAHAGSPNLAQGAAMALEDAALLADLLAHADRDQVGPALLAFAARRAPRIRWIRAQTHRRDRTRSLNPVLRDVVIRVAGEHMFRAAYRPLRVGP